MTLHAPIAAVAVRAADLSDPGECARLDSYVAGHPESVFFHRPQWSLAVEQGCGQRGHYLLAEEGYAYSSSVAPVAHDHYGWREAPRFAHRPLAGSELIELPVTTVELGGRRMAAGGGGFFRLLPYRFSSWAIDRVNRGENRPAVFYFHPWEIDPGQPRVEGAPLRSRLRHYSRLSAMRPKLLKLFNAHNWGRTDEVVERERERMS